MQIKYIHMLLHVEILVNCVLKTDRIYAKQAINLRIITRCWVTPCLICAIFVSFYASKPARELPLDFHEWKAGFPQVPPPFQSIQGMWGLKRSCSHSFDYSSFHKPRDPFVQGCCAKVWSGNATALKKTILLINALRGRDSNVANLLWMLFQRAQSCQWSPSTEDMQGPKCCKFHLAFERKGIMCAEPNAYVLLMKKPRISLDFFF